MGGIGSGGRRPGTGRKRKSALQKAIGGHAGHRGKVLTHPSAAGTAVAVVEEFDAPDGLTFDERAVWLRLAPHAFAARTLTKATALAFELLCRNVVLERRLAASALGCAGADHRGLIQRVDAELLGFNLRPCGKATYDAEPETVTNPLDKFRNRTRG